MRKTVDVVIAEEGRDKGKIFRLTEMPAAQAERWGFRVFQAVLRAGIEVPANMMGAGMEALAIIGLKGLANIPHLDAFDLMAEMMECVTIVRDPAHMEIAQKVIEDQDIEEIATRLYLRDRIFELHTGFSIAGAMSGSTSTPAKTSEGSPSTPTSPASSAS